MRSPVMAGVAIHLDQVFALNALNLKPGLNIYILFDTAISQCHPDVGNALAFCISRSKVNRVLNMPVDAIPQSFPLGTAACFQ